MIVWTTDDDDDKVEEVEEDDDDEDDDNDEDEVHIKIYHTPYLARNMEMCKTSGSKEKKNKRC